MKAVSRPDHLSTAGQDLKQAPEQTLLTSHDMRHASTQSFCGPSVVLEAGLHMATSATVPPQSHCGPPAQNFMNYAYPAPQSLDIPVAANASMPDWRCIHGSVVVSAAVPEIHMASDCCICIQWPTVVHASAYVVEVLDQCNMTAQRFMHASPDTTLPPVMEFRVDGVPPSTYTACVRCIAPCGCQSAASLWSLSSVTPFTRLVQTPKPSTSAAAGGYPRACPPPPTAPPSLPLTTTTEAASLPPIPEETIEAAANFTDEILTLD